MKHLKYAGNIWRRWRIASGQNSPWHWALMWANTRPATARPLAAPQSSPRSSDQGHFPYLEGIYPVLQPRREVLLAAVSDALTKVACSDSDLLKLDAHELAVVHRFAVSLEASLQPALSQRGLSVDLDYDRHGEGKKWLPPRTDDDGNIRFRADLIVHRRRDDTANLLVVEWKKHATDEVLANMRQRLVILVAGDDGPSAYRYELGVLVDKSRGRDPLATLLP